MKKSLKVRPDQTLNMEGGEPTALLNLLLKIGLEIFYPNKLTLQSLLEINKNSVNDEAVSSVEDTPWCFLRKLFKLNAECRSCTQLSNKDDDEEDDNDDYDEDIYIADDPTDQVNPLDLIVALFLCADSFLQQEMALKMSMCQFSVPLLLPHGDNSQFTLMLWALRDIVKEWRPHDLSGSKGFVEDNIVQADIPCYAFVRLKNCSLSKSQILNNLLSRGQHNHNMFIHRDMEGGSLEKTIADGLVEVCWYLPCGTESADLFSKPIALANLRGDIGQSLTQFSFLFQVATATFVFLDKVEENEHKILTSLPPQDVRSKLFLVVNQKDGSAKEDMSVKALKKALDLPKTNVKTKDRRLNMAEFSKKLCATIKKMLTDVTTTVSVVEMFNKAIELGLCEDESKTHKQKKAAEKIVEDLGKQSIPDYKRNQLHLQGENWKRFSQLEKEECRIKGAAETRAEEYKSQLQEEKQNIMRKQSTLQLSTGMKKCIEILSTSNRVERDYFLHWMKFLLNTHSREKLTELRQKFKEQCSKKNVEVIMVLDQALVESSLGLEHYIREMGLIYEFSSQSPHTKDKVSHLPGLAAEMLLDGYPLELLDGDASNIPQRWVTDVLMELHRKVGEKSRLLVLTVLGVQSTGKSTLLNTMFGVQFPVSSGRCTRGAYMLFLRVGEDMQSQLNYDFIVLIDTEGLKSPDLAQLEDSYEHDNQLATFVIGLSDVTIINVAMENFTEMKDVLQIATHAFLRMKEIGKKPICHFVHQNVAGVSAHEKNMTDRKHLFDQLNEMTQIAAEMETQPSKQTFTDIMDYDVEKNHWNIPGLWHGTPPMAPVNTGYSEAVAEFKRNLLETVKRDKGDEVSQIPEFLEWMRSLWRAVKFENFIFSFRNTLVANAYDNLCKEFSDWEWEFRKEIFSWQNTTEMEISNADKGAGVFHWSELVELKKSEASDKIADQHTIMTQKLQEYYKRKDRHVNLIEKYRSDFSNQIRILAKEIQHSADNALDCALEHKKSSQEVEDLQRKHREVIEEQVMKLLKNCKDREDCSLSDEELKGEFETMWAKVTGNVYGLKEKDIAAKVLKQLQKHFGNLNVTEDLKNITDLKEVGENKFKVTSDHLQTLQKVSTLPFVQKVSTLPFVQKVSHFLPLLTDSMEELQLKADTVIESCTQFVQDTAKTDRDYHDNLTRDLLAKIDKSLHKNYKTKFVTDLKIHICGIASQEFQHMHRRYLKKRDPKVKLEENKKQYMTDFIDLYKERDHSQRKAADYIRGCIKPAVEEYISRCLGVNVVDEVCHSAEYSSRSFFQYNIQEELLQKEDFDSFVKFICKYEIYVKDWIFQHVQQKMSEDQTLCRLKKEILMIIFNKVTKALEESVKCDDGTLLPDTKESIPTLINNMRKYLVKEISMSVENEKATLFQIQCTSQQFINSLKDSLEDLKKEMQEEFKKAEDISETLSELPTKPQDELFRRTFGCGHQCPFCKVPCEAGGKEHNKHHAAVHRPQGLSTYRSLKTHKLVETLCTTDVHSECKFKSPETQWELHPYKDYTKYYPDWLIPPDRTIEASDYWKYVLVTYNDRFAEKYKAKPAVVPEAWKRITKEQALKGLKEAFNVA